MGGQNWVLVRFIQGITVILIDLTADTTLQFCWSGCVGRIHRMAYPPRSCAPNARRDRRDVSNNISFRGLNGSTILGEI